MKVKRFVKEFKPIEIKEPFKTDIIEFADPIEFTKYYREHEDEFSNMSTYKLNVRYKIPGYKISQPRTKGKNDSGNIEEKTEIKLIKDYRGNITPNDKTNSLNENDYLKERIELLEKRITNIENYLSNVPQE